MLRPFNKLTCESENQNLEAKITGLREKVQLREETASCTYISHNTRNVFYFTTSEFNEIFADISNTSLVYEFDQTIIFIGLACARLQAHYYALTSESVQSSSEI